jgi:hypothetical protein
MNLIALAIYAILLRIGIYVMTIIGRAELAHYNQIPNKGISEIEFITNKIDFLFQTIAGVGFASTASLLFVYLGGTLILSYVGANTITERIEPERPSFVVLTRRALLDREERLKRYEKNWQAFLVAFVVAVVAGVIGNVVTWYVWG